MNEKEEEVITKVKFYSELKDGEKIEFDPLQVRSESMFNSIFRTFWYSSNRYEVLEKIKNFGSKK